MFQAQSGYEYNPPSTREQLKIEGQDVDHSQGGPHGDMDDPLAWLRESVPGDVMPTLKLPMSVVWKSVPVHSIPYY